MSFQDLQSTVHQVWEFVWPPVLILFLLIASAIWLAPTVFERMRSRIGELVTIEKGRRIRSVLRAWGLSKLLPIAFAFVLLFMLYFTARLVFAVGALVPPSVVYSPHVIVIRHSDEFALSCLAAQFKGQPDASALLYAARAIYDSPEYRKNSELWRNKAIRSLRFFAAVKFFACWLVGLTLAERLKSPKLRWRRYTLGISTVLILGTVSILNYVFFTQRYLQGQASAASYELTRSKACRAHNLSPRDRERLRSARQKLDRESWWYLDAGVTQYASWLYGQISPDPPNPIGRADG